MKKIRFFRNRRAFHFSRTSFDVGPGIPWFKAKESSKFINKVRLMDMKDYEAFYTYQLDHFKTNNPDHNEEEFHAHVWQIVENTVSRVIMKDKFEILDEYHVNFIKKLRGFQAFVINYLPVDIDKNKDEIIIRLENEVLKQSG